MGLYFAFESFHRRTVNLILIREIDVAKSRLEAREWFSNALADDF